MISASFHHASRRDRPSTDAARDTTRKISFKPTSRRSSHLQTDQHLPAPTPERGADRDLHGIYPGDAGFRRPQVLAARPDGPFSTLQPSAPGELMEIDSTPLGVLVRLDGVEGRADLTAMIDVATRTVTAAVLQPTAKAADASVPLARTVTPEPMRPGWAKALAMSASALPHRRLSDIDARIEAAGPVIIPDTIVADHGKGVHVPELPGFVRLARHQPAARPQGNRHRQAAHRADPGVGRTLFAQFAAGYTGRSPEYRGHGEGQRAVWSLRERGRQTPAVIGDGRRLAPGGDRRQDPGIPAASDRHGPISSD
jgi:hypothetical protein